MSRSNGKGAHAVRLDERMEWDAACRLAAARGAVLLRRKVPDWWQRVDVCTLRAQGPGHLLKAALGDRDVLAYVLLGGPQSLYVEREWMTRHGFALDPSWGCPTVAAGLDALLGRWAEAVDYERRRAEHAAHAEGLRQQVLRQIREAQPRVARVGRGGRQ